MSHIFKIKIDGWKHKTAIPAKYAFGQPGKDEPFATSDNISPRITWENPPAETQSFALICHDPDVPSSAEDVNQEGRTVPASLARVPFHHWVLIDIPSELSELPEAIGSEGVTPRGKPCAASKVGLHGQNDYTHWFAGDKDMEGIYGAYDGPCPPWNDSIAHRYYFTLYALSEKSLGISNNFTAEQAIEAMKGKVLGQCEYMGTYSMNPKVSA